MWSGCGNGGSGAELPRLGDGWAQRTTVRGAGLVYEACMARSGIAYDAVTRFSDRARRPRMVFHKGHRPWLAELVEQAGLGPRA